MANSIVITEGTAMVRLIVMLMETHLHEKRMFKMQALLAVIFLILIPMADLATVQPTYCPNDRTQRKVYDEVISTPAPQSLVDLGETEFVRQRVDVLPGVYFYIGYALSNLIVIDAPDGLIMIDTLESNVAMEAVLEDIQENIRPDKKLKAIMYTHHHVDHFGGAISVLHSNLTDDTVEVWAYQSLIQEFWDKWQFLRPRHTVMGWRQLGVDLPKGAHITTGVGLKFVGGSSMGQLLVPPDHLLEGDQLEVHIAGLDMTLVYIPGETRDHMGIYIPEKKLFMSGDDIYKAFPNLYAIRGSPPRPVEEWANSLITIRNFDIEILLPSHSMPIYGRKNVQDTLTVYRDAIQYVHDQTTRLMNRGHHPDEIAQNIKLPESIRSHPYVVEHYGVVEWGSKAVFESHLGWFSGFPEDLFPLTPTLEAKYWNTVLSYSRAILSIKKSIRKGDNESLRWALKLATVLWNNRENLRDRQQQKVLALRSEALRLIAAQQVSSNARNYLLRWILEENCNNTNAGPAFTDFRTITRLPLDNLMKKIAVMLKAEDLDGVRLDAVLGFTDVGRTFTMMIRNNVLEALEEDVTSADIRIFVSLSGFKQVLLRAATLEEVGAEVFPDYETGDQFMAYFDDPNADYF